MKCIECKLYDSNPLWNHCYLTDQDCFYTYDLCPYINDDYVCIIDCEALGIMKGAKISQDKNNNILMDVPIEKLNNTKYGVIKLKD